MFFVGTLILSIIIYQCKSECDTVNSMKHGKLILSQSEKSNSECIGNLIFRSKETGYKFCLNKKRREVDLAKLTCAGCLCGQENKPDTKWKLENKTVRIVGGDYTGENQYPWYALLFIMMSTLYNDTQRSGGKQWCGGSLVTEKVVLSAAHCVDDPKRGPSDYWIGLGIHNISGFSNWTREEFSKHVIMEVDEIILHDEWRKSRRRFFDFALLILKHHARFSLYISPVCLPKKEEIDILERGRNIVVGFGTSKIWYIEYNKLMGGKLKSASLIPPDLLFNKSALTTGFTEGNLEKNIIDGYFRTFTELFPGIEICVKNYEFVCNITKDTLETILRNMELKIRNSGTKNENKDVQDFLDVSRKHILPDYMEHINNWKNLTSLPYEEKLMEGTYWLEYVGLDMKTVLKIMKQFKFVNQWYFIKITEDIVRKGFGINDALKMARGKFVPWSEVNKWNDIDPFLKFQENPSQILVERFGMEEGYSCYGDSGGPLVALSNGSFVLVASVHAGRWIQYEFSWPPPCHC